MQENQANVETKGVEDKRLSTYLLTLICTFCGYILFICLNAVVGSNIVFDGTMLYEVTEWVYLGAELAAFFVAYAFTIYVLFSKGCRRAWTYAWVYAAVTAGRHVLLFLLDWLFFGLRVEDMPFQAAMTLVTLLLELLQYAAVFGMAMLLTHRFDERFDIMTQGALRLTDVIVVREHLVYPYRKIPLLNDPLRGTSVLTAVLIGAIRVGNRLIYDVSLGAPTDAVDLAWMLAYYTMDILIAVACYFVLLAIIKRLSTHKSV
ncbi:MAG: hypothetical protein E7625_01850 [Ruminococcaceae bacterium]|nr:hypothetical protein [Oscillospiraceae bacterium]